MNPDGTEAAIVTSARWVLGSHNCNPVWSPDGMSIALWSIGKGLFKVDRDGKNCRRIAIRAGLELNRSPDGRWFSFSSYRPRQLDNHGVFLVPHTGGTPRRLIPGDVYSHGTSWFPDSKRLVCRLKEDEASYIAVVNVDGSGLTRLTDGSQAVGGPVISPDGKRIAYGATEAGSLQIFVRNADGTASRRLTGPAYRNQSPFWSPAGSKVYFTTRRNDNWEIGVVNVDGTGERNLTNSAASEGYPSISPDGSDVQLIMGEEKREGQLVTWQYLTPRWSPPLMAPESSQ